MEKRQRRVLAEGGKNSWKRTLPYGEAPKARPCRRGSSKKL